MKFRAIEPNRGEFVTEIADLMIDWAQKSNLTVRGKIFFPASHRFISYFVQLSHSFKQVYKLHFMYQSITITKSFVSEFKMFAGDGKGQNLTLILKRCIMRPSLER